MDSAPATARTVPGLGRSERADRHAATYNAGASYRLPGYSETLLCEPESAAIARRLVRVALAVWGLDDLADDGALIVSELVSNAVRHARRGSIRLTVDRPGAARVCIGVVDFSKVPPVPKEPDDEDDAGVASYS